MNSNNVLECAACKLTADGKTLECDFCKDCLHLDCAEFPEDLYNMIVKYKNSQLIWLCLKCKRKKEQNFIYFLSLAEKQKEMDKTLKGLTENIKRIESDIAQINQSGKNLITENSNDDTGGNSDAEKTSSPQISDKTSEGKSAVTICGEILKSKIKIDEDMSKKSKKIVTEFLESLVDEMKSNDELFKLLFNKLYYTGSFYEDLRVATADEFDINLILNLPFRADSREIEYIPEVKSFAKFKCKISSATIINDPNIGKYSQVLKKFLDDEDYLISGNIRDWMQSVVDRAVKKMALPENVIEIVPSQSGPAKTMKLHTSHGYQIDIDLVPVLQFCYPEWPKDVDSEILIDFSVPSNEQLWFLVPKEYGPFLTDVSPSTLEVRRLWRMHFPEVEKRVIYNKQCVKPLIKLLKLLRNKEKWTVLASYYLKTVLLWKVKENPNPLHWKMNKIYERLIEALKYLGERVSERNLPYFFYPDFNLIQKMGPIQGQNLNNRLQKIITSIEKNPAKLYEYF